MIEISARAIVVLAGLYLVGLAVAAFIAPARTSRFLLGHASSARAHYLELSLRLVVGAAFVQHARQMLLPDAFLILGWVLIITSAGLLLVPWRWHHRFAQWSVPQALRFLPLIGLASLALGSFVLLATLRSAA